MSELLSGEDCNHLQLNPSPTHISTSTNGLRPNQLTAIDEENHAYQRKVGSLLYAAVITRPDIAYAASKLSEHLRNPSAEHCEPGYRIPISNEDSGNPIQWEDGESPHIRSIQRCCICRQSDRSQELAGIYRLSLSGTNRLKASKQNTVSASSTEAELLSLSKTAREVFWWTRLFKDIRLDIGHQPSAQCDNRLTIRLLTAETAKLNIRLRHVDVYHHWLRQSVQTGGIGFTWVSTVEKPAGGPTKALPVKSTRILSGGSA